MTVYTLRACAEAKLKIVSVWFCAEDTPRACGESNQAGRATSSRGRILSAYVGVKLNGLNKKLHRTHTLCVYEVEPDILYNQILPGRARGSNLLSCSDSFHSCILPAHTRGSNHVLFCQIGKEYIFLA